MALTDRIQTYLDAPSPVAWTLPPLACDAHVHVFGPATHYPYSAQRQFTPVDAPRETLFALHAKLGIARCVIVQSMLHGLDNRVVADAMAAAPGRYLGVALVSPESTVNDLKALARQGFRGVRFNFAKHLGTGIAPAELPAFSHRLADAGLHLQVHFESALVHTLAPILRQCAVPVVVDHMGRVNARLGPQHEDFQALCRWLDAPHTHVKISGIDRVDAHVPLGVPPYPAGVALAAWLMARFPEQCLWGTDWPHPNHTHVPDDGVLVNAVPQFAPTAALQQALLVDNPQRLYRFDTP